MRLAPEAIDDQDHNIPDLDQCRNAPATIARLGGTAAAQIGRIADTPVGTDG